MPYPSPWRPCRAYRFNGSPEGDLALAQAAVYLATAPKSNSIYTAYGKACEVVRQTGALPVPLHIRNAPTGLMKDLGYGRDYKYAHYYPDAHVRQEYLPDQLLGQAVLRSPGPGIRKKTSSSDCSTGVKK